MRRAASGAVPAPRGLAGVWLMAATVRRGFGVNHPCLYPFFPVPGAAHAPVDFGRLPRDIPKCLSRVGFGA
ncbi:hypothetical protein GCM10009715_19360 [Paeniglutamicibacter psychrophenolicus]